MNDFCFLGEMFDVSRDPVVEARAHGNEQVGFLQGRIGRAGAVHTRHADKERMIARKTSMPHERERDRRIDRFSEFAQFIMRAGKQHAAARVNNRFFRRCNRLSRFFYLHRVTDEIRLVRPDRYRFRIDIRFKFRT